jgi:hypothetical protein
MFHHSVSKSGCGGKNGRDNEGQTATTNSKTALARHLQLLKKSNAWKVISGNDCRALGADCHRLPQRMCCGEVVGSNRPA